ncbi:hypothetical protein BC628DRAFT_624092 [Trametes gibbosa]|nr:hypothetical protein BC628DRAFT_624092 [Trametes gibbosa]
MLAVHLRRPGHTGAHSVLRNVHLPRLMLGFQLRPPSCASVSVRSWLYPGVSVCNNITPRSLLRRREQLPLRQSPSQPPRSRSRSAPRAFSLRPRPTRRPSPQRPQQHLMPCTARPIASSSSDAPFGCPSASRRGLLVIPAAAAALDTAARGQPPHPVYSRRRRRRRRVTGSA